MSSCDCCGGIVKINREHHAVPLCDKCGLEFDLALNGKARMNPMQEQYYEENKDRIFVQSKMTRVVPRGIRIAVVHGSPDNFHL